jgi:hypothetical protein
MNKESGRNRRCSFCLDARVMMDNALLVGERSVYNWSFALRSGTFIPCTTARGSSAAGRIHLDLKWPEAKHSSPSGLVAVSHPKWKTLPRFALLIGIRNLDGGHLWRFLCPITRQLVQVVCYDSDSGLLVSPAALGRPQRKADFHRIERDLTLLLPLQEKYGDLEERPAGMTDFAFEFFKLASDALTNDFYFAASGLPAPILDDDGWPDVLAMTQRRVQHHSKSGVFYRDRSGALKLNARSKKRLGIS